MAQGRDHRGRIKTALAATDCRKANHGRGLGGRTGRDFVIRVLGQSPRQVMRRLQVHPELGCRVEVAA